MFRLRSAAAFVIALGAGLVLSACEAENAECSEHAPSDLCCCLGDVVFEPVCNGSRWGCDQGYEVHGDDCAKCVVPPWAGPPPHLGQPPDAGADGGKKVPCWEIETAWQTFVAENDACTVAEDCIVVGGTGDCGCLPVLGAPSGDAIQKTAQAAAELLLERFAECRSEGYVYAPACDAAPATDLRCESGKCAADAASCTSADAG